MQDWTEVDRLFHRERLSKARIARQLGMSRNTVERLLRLSEPPAYVRPPALSKLDPFKDQVRAMLAADPSVASTVICERLRREGFDGSVAIVKRFVATVRPQFAAAGRVSADLASARGDRAGRLVAHRPADPGGLALHEDAITVGVGGEIDATLDVIQRLRPMLGGRALVTVLEQGM